MLDSLKPISKEHSIARVTATFILAQDILKLENLIERLKIMPEFSRYQRKVIQKARKIKVNFDGTGEKNDVDSVVGFVFEEFDETGQIKNLIRVTNDIDQNRGLIIFETRKYERWDSFFFTMKNDIGAIFSTNRYYTKAINLNYVDEFRWVSNDVIPVNEIFNIESELINKKFLNSENGSILMLSQNKELNVEESTEISFNNRLKRIVINHQFGTEFKDILSNEEVLYSELLKDQFKIAHDANKEMLSDLLTDTVSARIGIN